MISYRDMTFCKSDCTNKQCYRFLNDKVWDDAAKWWGNDNAPVAISDFSGYCPDYVGDKTNV